MPRALLTIALLTLPLVAAAQETDGGIDVIDVSGPLDASALEFISTSIEGAARSGQEMAVVQVNSRAVLDGETYDRVIGLISEPPLPVAVWVGPAPAAAFGGVRLMVEAAPQKAVSPGSVWGISNPVVLGEDRPEVTGPMGPEPAEEWGLELQPTLRQYLQDLDGRTFQTSSGERTVSTLRDFEGGVTVKEVTFRKPGLVTRFFRLAVTPEAAFFFLVIGLSVLIFEFYALGPGVAAAVASISLILAGWGLVTLPTRWWALVAVVAGWVALTAAYQRGGFLGLTVLGAALMQVGGSLLVDGGGQIDSRWWLVLPSVLAVLFFFLIAMPTVQRARLSTATIGREGLIGHRGIALVDFDPDGLVEVDGARWRATAHREAGLSAGSPVVVTGVDGMYLEVDPQVDDRET